MKTKISELAIFGGVPAFSKTLHVGAPNIGDRTALLARITDILDRRWLTNNGVYVQEFEEKIRTMIGVEHCVATCNGTVALELAVRAAGLSGQVIVPSFTFVATAHALKWQEIEPVFCDVDPQSHTIDPGKVEALITPKTTGLIGVHLWGRTCDVEALTDIARRHNLKLLFDAAHSFACSHKSRMVGNFGDAETFSFHATKVCNSFEGGAVLTNDSDLAGKLRLMRNFGFVGYDSVSDLGINGKMSEVSAAMGITSLESLDRFIDTNRRNYERYLEGLRNIPGVHLTRYDPTERNNYQYIIMDIDSNVTDVTRDQLLKLLHAENVLARRYFFPGCHRMKPYQTDSDRAQSSLPETDRLAGRLMALPSGEAVGPDDIDGICDLVRFAVANGREIAHALFDAP